MSEEAKTYKVTLKGGHTMEVRAFDYEFEKTSGQDGFHLFYTRANKPYMGMFLEGHKDDDVDELNAAQLNTLTIEVGKMVDGQFQPDSSLGKTRPSAGEHDYSKERGEKKAVPVIAEALGANEFDRWLLDGVENTKVVLRVRMDDRDHTVQAVFK